LPLLSIGPMIGRPGHGVAVEELLGELANGRPLHRVVPIFGAEDGVGPGAPAASTSWVSG
jgi:hypothetical protein